MQFETKFARSGEARIAYQVFGQGDLDIVLVPCFMTDMDRIWREPRFLQFVLRLASFARVIAFDKRGSGRSDPAPSSEPFTLEGQMDDLTAVLDAVGSDRALLFGLAAGGRLAALYGATYPERVRGLVLYGASARGKWAPDYPWAPTDEEYEHLYANIRQGWGGPVLLDTHAPSVKDDPEFGVWWAECLRSSTGPAGAIAAMRLDVDNDIRAVLPSIQAPTLVMHRRDDRVINITEGRYLANNIPGARFVELPGLDHLSFVGDQEPLFRAIEQFISTELDTVPMRRAVATVVSVNITGVAGLARRLGAEGWATSRNALLGEVRKALVSFRSLGAEEQGQGFLAAFDGPSRALSFAREMVEIVRRHRLHAQIGVHAGSVEHTASHVGGVAAELATRIALHAGRDEVLVSSTLVGLVSGSGLTFRPVEDGEFERLPAGLRVYRVAETARADSTPAARLATTEVIIELTPREYEVAMLVAQGHSNRLVSETLSISISTVERHVANILMKLGYRSRSQLSAWAAAQRAAESSIQHLAVVAASAADPGPGAR
jgi:pimeloyl-ACP methyl ester carboxylesterase/DNA-binding CsgD family transcriptional regulator